MLPAHRWCGRSRRRQGTTSVRGLEPILEPVAGPVDRDDVAVVQQPVQDGRGQHVVAEHLAPFAEGVGCQKSVVAVTSRYRLTKDYDAPSLIMLTGGGLVWSGRSSTWRCAVSLN
jgi:hypothetical protein